MHRNLPFYPNIELKIRMLIALDLTPFSFINFRLFHLILIRFPFYSSIRWLKLKIVDVRLFVFSFTMKEKKIRGSINATDWEMFIFFLSCVAQSLFTFYSYGSLNRYRSHRKYSHSFTTWTEWKTNCSNNKFQWIYFVCLLFLFSLSNYLNIHWLWLMLMLFNK